MSTGFRFGERRFFGDLIFDTINLMQSVIKFILVVSVAGLAISLVWIVSINVGLFNHSSPFAPSKDQPLKTSGDPSDRVEAVVSAHELATNAGFEILDKGGTAADAAVAVASVLSVVEPWFSSALGGGTWALYYEASSGDITSLDGVGSTGSKATASDYRNRAGQAGMHQAIIPGAWDGWMLWLEEYGKLDLGDILAPAIRIARAGFPVSADMETWLNSQSDETLARPDTAKIYAPEGSLLRKGETVFQIDMADTFESLVDAYNSALDSGRSGAIQAARNHFYRGPIAEKVVEFSDSRDGYLTLSDFSDFSAQILEPIYIDYDDDIKVFQNPPNSQGITMLLALNILKDYDLSDVDLTFADRVHLQAEAIKLAFADRYYHVGDPDRVDVPVSELLSDDHADRQRSRIDMENAMSWPVSDIFETTDSDIGNTTTFHVLDSEGNGAAVTTSLGAQFYVVGDTGIHINHRMRFLALDDGDPNQVAPGYKVRHTSNPYLALKNGKLYILGGNTGADSQSQAQAQQFLNVVEFGMSAQESVSSHRFLSTAFPSTVYSYQVRNTLQVEDGFPQDVIDDLEARGHSVTVGDGIWGNGNMIVIENGGEGADVGAEPRSDVSFGERKVKGGY